MKRNYSIGYYSKELSTLTNKQGEFVIDNEVSKVIRNLEAKLHRKDKQIEAKLSKLSTFIAYARGKCNKTSAELAKEFIDIVK